MKHKYWIWMGIGCGLPLLLIFLTPALGIKSKTWLFTFIVLMFVVHLIIPMRHGSRTHGLSDENLKKGQKKGEQHN